MKTTVLLILMITLFTFNVLGQSGDVKSLLENRDTREEVFSTILNDHNLMMEFMDRMSGNAHAMAMMRGNHMMMMNLQEESQTQAGHMGTGYGMMGQGEESQTQSGHMGMDHGMMGYEGESRTQAGQMGTGHGNMMGMSYDNPELIREMGHLMDQCKTDSTVCMELTDVIAQHPDMMRMIMRRMHSDQMIK